MTPYIDVTGAPHDHVVLDRKRGLFIAAVGDDPQDVRLTPNLAEAARFAKVEVLINDLATVTNGFSFIHQDDPRLVNKWPLPEKGGVA